MTDTMLFRVLCACTRVQRTKMGNYSGRKKSKHFLLCLFLFRRFQSCWLDNTERGMLCSRVQSFCNAPNIQVQLAGVQNGIMCLRYKGPVQERILGRSPGPDEWMKIASRDTWWSAKFDNFDAGLRVCLCALLRGVLHEVLYLKTCSKTERFTQVIFPVLQQMLMRFPFHIWREQKFPGTFATKRRSAKWFSLWEWKAQWLRWRATWRERYHKRCVRVPRDLFTFLICVPANTAQLKCLRIYASGSKRWSRGLPGSDTRRFGPSGLAQGEQGVLWVKRRCKTTEQRQSFSLKKKRGVDALFRSNISHLENAGIAIGHWPATSHCYKRNFCWKSFKIE